MNDRNNYMYSSTKMALIELLCCVFFRLKTNNLLHAKPSEEKHLMCYYYSNPSGTADSLVKTNNLIQFFDHKSGTSFSVEN